MPEENEAIYIQIAQRIRSRIFDGEYDIGEKLPSEKDLCEEYLATRGTIRRALGILTAEGFVYREKGRGTFASSPAQQQLFWGFGSLTDRLATTGDSALATVLNASVIVRENRRTFRLKRLRFISKANSKTPVSVDISYLPLDLLPGIDNIDFTDRSLYQVVKDDYDRAPANSIVSLNPRVIDRKTRELLEEPSTQKCLLHASGQTFDENGARIEETEITYSSRVLAVLSIDHVNGYTAPIFNERNQNDQA